jgi:hypothetical protein
MSITRSNLLKILKSITHDHQLSSDASDKLELLINKQLLPKIILSSFRIASNRSGGKRKITKEDVDNVLFILLPFSIYTLANNEMKHSKVHYISTGATKKFGIKLLENNDRQYQKLQTESALLINSTIQVIIRTILHDLIIRNTNTKRINSEHIISSIARNKDISLLFPVETIQYYSSQEKDNKKNTQVIPVNNSNKKPNSSHGAHAAHANAILPAKPVVSNPGIIHI